MVFIKPLIRAVVIVISALFVATAVAAENRTYSILPIEPDIQYSILPVNRAIHVKIPTPVKNNSTLKNQINQTEIQSYKIYTNQSMTTGNLTFSKNVNVTFRTNESVGLPNRAMPVLPIIDVELDENSRSAKPKIYREKVKPSNATAAKPIKGVKEGPSIKAQVGNFIDLIKKLPEFIKNIFKR